MSNWNNNRWNNNRGGNYNQSGGSYGGNHSGAREGGYGRPSNRGNKPFPYVSRHGKTREDKPFIYVKWRNIHGIAYPYHNTQMHTSKTGTQWENWLYKFKSGGRGAPEQIVSCLLNLGTGRLHINKLGIGANPNKGTSYRLGGKK